MCNNTTQSLHTISPILHSYVNVLLAAGNNATHQTGWYSGNFIDLYLEGA